MSKWFAIPDFFKEQVQDLSAGRIQGEVVALIQELDNTEFRFYWLNCRCDEFIYSLEKVDKLSVAKFMLDKLMEKTR